MSTSDIYRLGNAIDQLVERMDQLQKQVLVINETVHKDINQTLDMIGITVKEVTELKSRSLRKTFTDKIEDEIKDLNLRVTTLMQRMGTVLKTADEQANILPDCMQRMDAAERVVESQCGIIAELQHQITTQAKTHSLHLLQICSMQRSIFLLFAGYCILLSGFVFIVTNKLL
jgi:hypothetical protein